MRPAPASASRGRYVVFQVADQLYAIPAASVEEIVPIAELTQSPGAPPILSGFLDISGEIIAVVSFRRLWGMPDRQPELYTPLILLRRTFERIALEVDSVACIVELGEQDLISMKDGCSFNQCAAAAVRVDGNTVLLLSPERLLLEQEQRRIAELTEFERQRLSSLVGTAP